MNNAKTQSASARVTFRSQLRRLHRTVLALARAFTAFSASDMSTQCPHERRLHGPRAGATAPSPSPLLDPSLALSPRSPTVLWSAVVTVRPFVSQCRSAVDLLSSLSTTSRLFGGAPGHAHHLKHGRRRRYYRRQAIHRDDDGAQWHRVRRSARATACGSKTNDGGRQ